MMLLLLVLIAILCLVVPELLDAPENRRHRIDEWRR